MLTKQYINTLSMKISDNPEPFMEKLVPETTIKETGDQKFIQPCPSCGHYDCCVITEGKPLVHCLSTGCDFKGNIVEALLKLPGVTEEAQMSAAAETYGLEIPNDKATRLQQIREIVTNYCHVELMKNGEYLKYQTEVRKHSIETLKQFKVGVSINYRNLGHQLLKMGFSMLEIKDAKAYIPEGLFVYPYYNRRTGELVRINTKGKPNEQGIKPEGYSWGAKDFYTTPTISMDSVILVEGENDLLSLWEVGATSVIALGGKPSAKQIRKLIELLLNCKCIYLFFDNDEAGREYTKLISEALSFKEVFIINYPEEFKDPDCLFKESDGSVGLAELIENAVESTLDGFGIHHQGHSWYLMTKKLNFKFTVLERDKKGMFIGDSEVYIDGQFEEHDPKGKVTDKRKKLPGNLAVALYEEMVQYYDHTYLEMDLSELMQCYRFSNRRSLIEHRMAEAVLRDGDIKAGLNSVGEKLKRITRDRVQKEIYDLQYAVDETEADFPRMKIAQFFSLKNNDVFFYFTRVVRDGDDYYSVPCLLNNKEEIRLDLFKLKSENHLLLVKGKYQLPMEVQVPIADLQEISLTYYWVDKYVGGEIPESEIEPSRLINRLYEQIKRFIYNPDDRVYKLLALWIYGTYCYELFGEFPYLHINGHKGNGKSTLDNVLYLFAFNCKFALKITEAALSRILNKEGGTLIIDETEFLSSRSKSQEIGLSTLLKGGYSRSSGQDYKSNPDKGNVTEGFDVFGPKAFSGINTIEDVLMDRAIPIPMEKVKGEDLLTLDRLKQYKGDHLAEIHELTSKCVLSVVEHFQTIFKQYNETSFIGDTARLSEILHPLFGLAKIAGKDYEEALFSYYNECIKPAKKETEDATPEGALQNVISDAAFELLGLENHGWIKEIEDQYFPDNAKIKLLPDSFIANQYWLKVALNMYFGGTKYPYSKITSYVLRTSLLKKEDIDKKNTTVTVHDELLERELGQHRVTTKKYRFYFRDFVPNWEEVMAQKKMKDKALARAKAEAKKVSLAEAIKDKSIIDQF